MFMFTTGSYPGDAAWHGYFVVVCIVVGLIKGLIERYDRG